jgi:hypothetical protein
MIDSPAPATESPTSAVEKSPTKTRNMTMLGQMVGYTGRAIVFSRANLSSNSWYGMYYNDTSKPHKERNDFLVVTFVVKKEGMDVSMLVTGGR